MAGDIQERKETWDEVLASIRNQNSGIRIVRIGRGAEDATLEPDSVKTAGWLFETGEETPPDLEGVISLLDPWLAQKPEGMIFGIRIRFSGIPDPEGAVSRLQYLYDHGLRLVHWLKEGEENPIHRALLWQASKMGVWNHISGQNLFFDSDPSGTGAWIANNPNIVHSFGIDSPPSSQNTSPPPGAVVPREVLSYGRLPDLPGVPFWQVLGDSRNILAALGHMGAKELQRLRTDLESGETFSLGAGLVYNFIRPGEIDSRTMDEIVAMVDAGGSVDITHVRANLEKAYLIAYVTERGVIVGNSSLKHPRQVFIDRLNRITGLDFTRFVERGYTSVRPEYRSMGIGAKLLEGLTCRATDVKVFSLISEDNLATQKIALRNNTRKIAVYYSEKVGKEMGVWMPEHMIDSRWGIEL